MPTTLTGVLLIAFLLLPGIAYVAVRERRTPTQKRSTFRETASVIVAGIVANITAIALILLIAKMWPSVSVNTDRLVRESSQYWQEDYLLIAIWVVILLIVAVAVAIGCALLAGQREPHTSIRSSWWTLFDIWRQNSPCIIQCELEDGSCISGRLGEFNTTELEDGDRDIILVAPIAFRPVGDTKYHPRPVSAACISARRIVTMFIAYEDPVISSLEAVAEEASAP